MLGVTVAISSEPVIVCLPTLTANAQQLGGQFDFKQIMLQVQLKYPNTA